MGIGDWELGNGNWMIGLSSVIVSLEPPRWTLTQTPVEDSKKINTETDALP